MPTLAKKLAQVKPGTRVCVTFLQRRRPRSRLWVLQPSVHLHGRSHLPRRRRPTVSRRLAARSGPGGAGDTGRLIRRDFQSPVNALTDIPGPRRQMTD